MIRSAMVAGALLCFSTQAFSATPLVPGGKGGINGLLAGVAKVTGPVLPIVQGTVNKLLIPKIIPGITQPVLEGLGRGPVGQLLNGVDGTLVGLTRPLTNLGNRNP